MADFRFLNAADNAIVVEFSTTIDRAVSERVLALARVVQDAALTGVCDVVATFRSLTVHYDSLVTTGTSVEAAILRLESAVKASTAKRILWHLPVCYEPACAPDLEDVARSAGLAPREVAALHAAVQYHVYMIGFVPGFAYLGDLPQALHLPRRADPRTRVPKGSLAIATSLTAVYPYESPGGWHLIGMTPIKFFDAATERGALLQAGDAVRFFPVDRKEYERIDDAVGRGDYVPDSGPVA